MKVTFSSTHSAFSVKAPAGTLVSLTGTPTEAVDGVYTIGDEGCINIDEQMLTKDIYLSITGEDYTVSAGARIAYPAEGVEVRAGSSVLPFKIGGKGGGGGSGGGCTYRGTTTTAISNGSTTNPITIDGESYTAVFGDVVVYNYTEFVFDGTQWSEFGRPFDTVPTQGSTNAVTSDGIYNRTPFVRGSADNSAQFGEFSTAEGKNSIAAGYNAHATGTKASAFGYGTKANGPNMTAIGKYNSPRTGDLFNVGNGSGINNRSNIFEVSETDVNVNGDIKKNNVSLPTPYTTMPVITSNMLGQIAQYVGTTGNGYTQGRFYVASTDGAAEPTYSWVKIGGGRTETVLWENTGTTNPDTITFSEAITNFDEVVIVTEFVENNTHILGYNTIQNTYNIGDIVRLWYYDNSVYASYTVASSTVLTKYVDEGSNWTSKIIGIKY